MVAMSKLKGRDRRVVRSPIRVVVVLCCCDVGFEVAWSHGVCRIQKLRGRRSNGC